MLDFDIVSFTKNWLSPAVSANNLMLQAYIIPDKEDRTGNAHGGNIVYDAHWTTFKIIRNETTTLIRSSKQHFYDTLAAKLKSENISPKLVGYPQNIYNNRF